MQDLEKLEKLSMLIAALEKDLLVLDKSMQVYIRNLPEHRLTEIAKRSADQAFEHIKLLKDEFAQLTHQGESQSGIDLFKWLEAIQVKKPDWEESFNIKVLFPGNPKLVGEKVDIDPNIFSSAIEVFLENAAVTGASAVELTYSLSDVFTVSIHDNGDGSSAPNSEQLKDMHQFLADFGINLRIQSIKDVGSSVIIKIPLCSK